MGGGSTILLWYLLCGGALTFTIVIAVALVFWGNRRRGKRSDSPRS